MFSDYTIVDLETTGLDPVGGRITEIAARRYRNGKLAAAMSLLVWAGIEPEAEAAKLNGLTGEVLQAQGLPEDYAVSSLLNLMHGSVLVAHNAAFEMCWLNQTLLRMCAKPFPNDFLCTKTLAIELKAGSGVSYSLKQLTSDLGIQWTGAAHRAMPDVVATKSLLDVLMQHETGLLAAGELINCWDVNAAKQYPLPEGLPAQAKKVLQ